MLSETFEQALLSAESAGSLNGAWKKFVNTRFYVPIVHSPDLDPKKITLRAAPVDGAAAPAVRISEVRERINEGDAVLWLNGAEILKRMQHEAGIVVALSDRVFAIAHDRVTWLRNGLEAAEARAAAKLQSGATTVARPAGMAAAPAPAAPAAAAVPPVPAAPPAPARPGPAPSHSGAATAPRAKGAPLDVAALKPRPVTIGELGLELFVPGAWREERSAKALRFHEQASGVRVEVSGFHRPGLTLAQWLDMRVALVGQEMRFLTQDGPAYALSGAEWGNRITGMAVEFTGMFPGETVAGRYLVACIHLDGTVVAITLRATADVFEQQRAVFQWMLGRVNLLGEEAIALYRAPAARGAAAGAIDDAYTETAAPFAMSLHGRIGRLRALAYSVLAVIPFAAIAALAAVLMPRAMGLAIVMAIAGLIGMIWFGMRLMVLRLHDVNLSGKWILLFFALSGVAGALQKPVLLAGVSILFWIFILVIYYIIPGTAGENNYGAPPGPNTPLVKLGAGVFLLFQLLGIYGNYKAATMVRGFAPDAAGMQADGPAEGTKVTFTPPDNSFKVDLPGTPRELPAPRWAAAGVTMRQYTLEQGGMAYRIQTLDFGPGQQDHYAMMNRAQDVVVGNDGTADAVTPFLFNNGVNGRDVRVKVQVNKQRAARMVFVGNTLVVVMVGGPDNAATTAHIDTIFKSFQLR